MIYEPNTTEWPIGALVIHDADAKTPRMLMRVTGRVKKTGKYKTRYAFPREVHPAWRRKVWINDISYLHDPARFGINIPKSLPEPPANRMPYDHAAGEGRVQNTQEAEAECARGGRRSHMTTCRRPSPSTSQFAVPHRGSPMGYRTMSTSQGADHDDRG